MTFPGQPSRSHVVAGSFAAARAAEDEVRAARRTRAALTVAGHSLDPVDCVELLSMLGLPDPDTRFAPGAWDRSPSRSPRDAHHTSRKAEGACLMTQGTVKWFNGTKGFGFITPAGGGADIFLHHSEIQGYDLHGVPDGRPVEFELAEGRQGPHATSVRVL